MSNINWERVRKNLRCPICGEPASIEEGTDGTQGFHTHRFPISRETARELSGLTSHERLLSALELWAMSTDDTTTDQELLDAYRAYKENH